MQTTFVIHAIPDDRPAVNRHKGNRVPLVQIIASTGDSLWHPDSLAMTPAQAREIAGRLSAFADAAENGEEKSERL